MTDKFTPGPWCVTGNHALDGSYEDYHVVAEDNHCIADMQFEANAHLIAAAPDMYEALDKLCYLLTESGKGNASGVEQGLKALAKARGEL